MTYQRLAYDDAASSREMASDCRAVEAALHLPRRPTAGERIARAAGRPAPGLRFEDHPGELAKPTVTVSRAAARLGGALHPYLD